MSAKLGIHLGIDRQIEHESMDLFLLKNKHFQNNEKNEGNPFFHLRQNWILYQNHSNLQDLEKSELIEGNTNWLGSSKR